MSSSQITTKLLSRRTKPEEYNLYKAGLEWDLIEPIVIDKREDLKSEYRWHDRLEPFHHQVTNLITFCRRLPVTLLADDVGLGKTISAGLIVSELMSRSRLSKILIVCPKLLGPQWQEELDSKFDIKSEIVIGRQLIKADPKETPAIITTYQSARLYLDSIPKHRFQMLILDEAHKLRNLYGVENPPKVAKCFRKALEERRFQFILMLTATPIQNRLWDLYSLVDLLTVARGHQNPFGSEGMFARKFIADNREQARQLKPDAKNEFRSIIYGYMSRIRRGDAKLYFPDRVVQMHKVNPQEAELKIIQTIAGPIQQLNRLAQISILQALTSSPHALMAQLNTMAKKGTVSQDLAIAVSSIVRNMSNTAKLEGLGVLIQKLKNENPSTWRLVVFTSRLETQITIQNYLETYGLKVGIINGSSGARNQTTLARFRKNPPEYNVIVSTEAGSEGLNLQVANVLVNYDLPWNPMIVEQRIGRIQRLASEHASVGIFNIILKGTFEEYIVGRLMEKLQMASQAIGDIEALLEASGINEDDENGTISFEEKIRQLVIASLSGKDVQEATRLSEQSISDAKNTLEREKESINSMLGGMDGYEYVGPRVPKLPKPVHSMTARDFTLAAYKNLGIRVTPHQNGIFILEENGNREYITFEENAGLNRRITLYAPGTPAFTRLVNIIIATGVYYIEDLDKDLTTVSNEITHNWVSSFGAMQRSISIESIKRCFEGSAIVRVRATVAHDSYERLINILCPPNEHFIESDDAGLSQLPYSIEDAANIGINTEKLVNAAKLDEAISEFSRFYLERRAQEMQSAGNDERKKKKLEDEFTPRLEMNLVALEGELHRKIKYKVKYRLDNEFDYEDLLTIEPHTRQMVNAPELRLCNHSGRTVPKTCLKKCQISGKEVLSHFLIKSEISSRSALPQYIVECNYSGKRVIRDEAIRSDVTGRLVAIPFLKTSELSGKRAEPEFIGQCEFTKAQALKTELHLSDISGKLYRCDEETRSAVSGKVGHRREFLICHETREPIILSEAEQCQSTGKYVRKGLLKECAVSKKMVLPSELSRCAVSGKMALKEFMVKSSLSETQILEQVAIRSAKGNFCAPFEAKTCLWSGRKCHPDDIRVCELTGIPIHIEFATGNGNTYLQPLFGLLSGIKKTADNQNLWETISRKAADALGKRRCRIETALISPDNMHLAICSEYRTFLGFRVQYAGLIYSLRDRSILGHLTKGRRTPKGWVEVK